MKMQTKRRFAETDEDELGKAQKLDMSEMSLYSLPRITVSIGTITKLDLSNNNLESIPESPVARLLNLVVLDVHSNQLLKTLPNSIGCLSKLKVLDVSGNLLESFPKAIENCRSLEEMSANFNKLTKLPDTMGFDLINLRKLSVNTNKLAFLPHSTSHMRYLNCLRSLPNDLENLIRLENLNVSQNFHYLQSLPFSIGLLISLVDLDVSYNRISILPDSMGCLIKLQKFQAQGNPFVSPPKEIMEQGFHVIREYLSA